MPLRYAFWIIVAGTTPTSFKARRAEELMPTLRQLQRTQPDTVLRWFERGRLWESPEAARDDQLARKKTAHERKRDWRPGGDHVDPRARFKVPRDIKRARFKERARRDRFDGPPSDSRPDQGPKPSIPPESRRGPGNPLGGWTPSSGPRGDRPFSNRPPGGDRPRGDRPFSNRPPGDRPRGDRPFSNRPPGDRPRGDRPFSNRPPGDRPRGDRPFSNRPPGDRPRGDRPFSNRPTSDRPRGDRPFSNRPPGDRPRSDRPFSKRPPSDRPRDDRSFSKRPPGGRAPFKPGKSFRKPFGKPPGRGPSGAKGGRKPRGPKGS
jgi:hypothetical protein